MKAYEIERRVCWCAERAARMPQGCAAVIGRDCFECAMRVHLAFGGLPRVWRFTDYWNVPPEDVPMLNVTSRGDGFVIDDTKTFGMAEFFVSGERRVYSDLSSWLDGDDRLERGRIGVATLRRARATRSCGAACRGAGRATRSRLSRRGNPRNRTGSERGRRRLRLAIACSRGIRPRGAGNWSGCMTCRCYRRRLRAPPPLYAKAGVATGGQCIWNEEAAAAETAYVVGGPEAAR